MATPPTPPANPYQQDAAAYLQKVMRLFGGYKQRSFAFLQAEAGQTLVDVGCGTGDDALALTGLAGPSGRVIGVDQKPELFQPAAAKAAAAGLAVDFIVGDAAALPLPDSLADRVRSDRVFQHLPDPDIALAEMIRVTKPGGWICALDVDWTSLLIDSAYPATTRAIIDFQNRRNSDSAAGTRLYGRFKRAGLVDVEAYAETVCVTDWPIACMIWGLDGFAAQAAAGGDIAPESVEAWLADLKERHAQETFFSAITGFVVRGRKPVAG
ncbi:MAG TPA: methyltransferase domain-containing protein [Kiritimatiellia bacterium]|nr:methyltransferase domain-containing protein [Kiritimatiellia bacterium]HMO52468.1 methyltransferase domain-containing protein [Kiritimatiellia bacterium]HMP00072.1 methyltransferase domain-containing protein [Kiritimatiellia bacterium]HMP97797.1 methyltransferase domain-containing protein [Kiritimatiellia bacterium]